MLQQFIKRWFNQLSLSSHLESYIMSGNPKSIYDVERLTREFELKLSQGAL